ncbi:hypothetical protein RclHR1_20900001 [Rhizophagus clarus]|uniref:DDE-1 domain-containing protein n=1 Tax=Rhizophagus clarus TaxID=94130 RepID=A0A2Z6QRA0_9GLOM|nr:hypothetical protein RclHR1_20900001 [Rhizophagus clarus]
MDHNFRAQNKKILLFIDNISSHIDSQQSKRIIVTGYDNNANGKEVTQLKLIHVEVAFLLPNTTNHLQPLDAEVIKSFKAHYK